MKLARRGRRGPGMARAAVLCVAVVGVVISSAALAQHSARYRAARGEYDALRTAHRADAAVADQTVPIPPAGSVALAGTGDSASEIPSVILVTAAVLAAPSPTAAPTATQIPYASAAMANLRARNPQAKGWITIPGTPVDYPVVRGEDNAWYLSRSFDGSKSPSGAIFMDHRNSGAWDEFVTVVYGHNMKDGSMFRSLREYLKPGYFEAHREIKVTGLYREWIYRVFAVFRCPAGYDMVPCNALADDHRQGLLYDIHARSQVNKGTLGWPKPDDRLLALVTCDTGNDGSFIAVLAKRL